MTVQHDDYGTILLYNMTVQYDVQHDGHEYDMTMSSVSTTTKKLQEIFKVDPEFRIDICRQYTYISDYIILSFSEMDNPIANTHKYNYIYCRHANVGECQPVYL